MLRGTAVVASGGEQECFHLVHVDTDMVEAFLLARMPGVRDSCRKGPHKPLMEPRDTSFHTTLSQSKIEQRYLRR